MAFAAETIIAKLHRLGCDLWIEDGKIKYRYHGNGKPNLDLMQSYLKTVKEYREAIILLLKEPQSPDLVRCGQCRFFNPGIVKGICVKFQYAWNGEQLQSPFNLHQCSSFKDIKTANNNNNRRGHDDCKN